MRYKVELSGTQIGMWEIHYKKWWQWKWTSTGRYFSNVSHALLEVGCMTLEGKVFKQR